MQKIHSDRSSAVTSIRIRTFRLSVNRPCDARNGTILHVLHPQQSKLQDDVPLPSSRSPRPHPVDGHGFCAVVVDLAQDDLAACGRDHSRRRDHPRPHHPLGQLRPRPDQGYPRGNFGRNPSARSGASGLTMPFSLVIAVIIYNPTYSKHMMCHLSSLARGPIDIRNVSKRK